MADGLVVFSLKAQRSLAATYNYKQPKKWERNQTPPRRRGQLSNKLRVYSGTCMEFISSNSIWVWRLNDERIEMNWFKADWRT